MWNEPLPIWLCVLAYFTMFAATVGFVWWGDRRRALTQPVPVNPMKALHARTAAAEARQSTMLPGTKALVN